MPIHDWTRVIDGTFHDFHTAWIIHLKETLNAGVLPEDCYAQAEQVAGEVGPDILALKFDGPKEGDTREGESAAVCTLAASPPRMRFQMAAEMAATPRPRRRAVIRHASDDKILAIIEVVSPGNKSNRHGIRQFVNKSIKILSRGIHLLIVDLFPPGKRDPRGTPGLIWREIDEDHPYDPPADKPLSLASYRAYPQVRAFIEPVAVGDALRDMPLFLDPESYVNVPLDATYQAAYRGVPRRWREVLEASP